MADQDQSEVAMTEQQEPIKDEQEVATQETAIDQTPTIPLDFSNRNNTSNKPTTTVATARHVSLTSSSSIQQRLQLQKHNWFTRLMSIEDIDHLVKVEFDKFGGFKLLKAFLMIYIISLIDIITDVLLSVSVTRSGSCIPIVMGRGAHAMIIIAAWFSTATAIIYSFYFKYLQAFIEMYKHKISFWSAIKLVSIKTELLTNMEYGSVTNDTNRYRLMNLFFEDVLQCMIGVIISFKVPKADILVILSMFFSAAAISYMVSKMIQWAARDYLRKKCKWCFRNCAKIGVNKFCDKTFKFFAFGGVGFAVGFLVLLPVWRNYERYDQTVYADYGFVVADVKYHIDYLHINASYSTSNNTVDWLDIELTATIDEDVRYLCIDADSNQFHKGVSLNNDEGISINEDDDRVMPVVCFVVYKRRLRIYFVDENENFAECYQSKSKIKWTENENALDEDNDFVLYDSWSDSETEEMTFAPKWKIDYSSTNTAYCDNI